MTRRSPVYSPDLRGAAPVRTPDVGMEIFERGILPPADRADELAHLHNVGGPPPPRRLARHPPSTAAISSIVRPEMTERGSVTTGFPAGSASASSIFTRSQASPFPVLKRVRAYPPRTFSPSSQKDTWPRPRASATPILRPSFSVRFR